MFKNHVAASAITACLFTSAAALNTPALAQSIRVSAAGLDLADPADRATLQHRIARASATVCDRGGAHLDTGVRKSQRVCRDETMRVTMATVEAARTIRLAKR